MYIPKALAIDGGAIGTPLFFSGDFLFRITFQIQSKQMYKLVHIYIGKCIYEHIYIYIYIYAWPYVCTYE